MSWRLILGVLSSVFLAYVLAPSLNHVGLMVSKGLGPRQPRIMPDDQLLLVLLTVVPGVIFSSLLDMPPPAALVFGIPYVILAGACMGLLTAVLGGSTLEVLVWGGVPLLQIGFILGADVIALQVGRFVRGRAGRRCR